MQIFKRESKITSIPSQHVRNSRSEMRRWKSREPKGQVEKFKGIPRAWVAHETLFPFYFRRGERSDKIAGRESHRWKGVKTYAHCSTWPGHSRSLRNNHLDLKTIAISPLSPVLGCSHFRHPVHTPNDRPRLFNWRRCREIDTICVALFAIRKFILYTCAFDIAKLTRILDKTW